MADEAIEKCAALVMETIPLVMRTVGREMHRRHGAELPMEQFGALMFLKEHRGASLSLMAKHRGVGVPSMSKLIEGLVQRGLATRETDAADRRRVILGLTEEGEAMLESVRRESVGYLTQVLGELSPEEGEAVVRGMELLRRAFAPLLARREPS